MKLYNNTGKSICKSKLNCGDGVISTYWTLVYMYITCIHSCFSLIFSILYNMHTCMHALTHPIPHTVQCIHMQASFSINKLSRLTHRESKILKESAQHGFLSNLYTKFQSYLRVWVLLRLAEVVPSVHHNVMFILCERAADHAKSSINLCTQKAKQIWSMLTKICTRAHTHARTHAHTHTHTHTHYIFFNKKIISMCNQSHTEFALVTVMMSFPILCTNTHSLGWMPVHIILLSENMDMYASPRLGW